MRVLFLTFDGCTHPAYAAASQRPYSVPVDLFAWLPILAGLLQPHPDVFIVVHSSWRSTYSSDEIGDMLGDLGMRYLGVTPLAFGRWDSVNKWLSHNSASSWRILDDSPREFPDPPPLELIVCHPLTGLSATYVQAQLADWLETS